MQIINPYGFIYITTNMINGKRYIGQKIFSGKWKSYLGSGVVLLKAIKKYGRQNFNRNIVDIAYSFDELNRLEIDWIKNYNAIKSEDYYNVADGGNSGNTFIGKTNEEMDIIRNKIRNARLGTKVKIETRIKISKALKNRKFSFETRKKMSIALTGRMLDEEIKRKISQTRILKKVAKGKNNPMYGIHICGRSHHNYGKHQSEISKQKQSNTMKDKYKNGETVAPFKGKHLSEDIKIKISKTRKEKGIAKGKNNPRAKQVVCITTGKVFNTMKEGCLYYGIKSLGNLSNNIKNNKPCGKLNGRPLKWKILSK